MKTIKLLTLLPLLALTSCGKMPTAKTEKLFAVSRNKINTTASYLVATHNSINIYKVSTDELVSEIKCKVIGERYYPIVHDATDTETLSNYYDVSTNVVIRTYASGYYGNYKTIETWYVSENYARANDFGVN